MTCSRLGNDCIGCLDGDSPGRMFEIIMQILWDAMRAMSMYQVIPYDNCGDSRDEMIIERSDLAAVVALLLHRRDLHISFINNNSYCI